MENKEQRLIRMLTDQVKEAQIKLGYVKETIRLYIPLDSLNAVLGTKWRDADEGMAALEQNRDLQKTYLGAIQFAVQNGRIEISIPPEGVEYVHREITAPPFLQDIIHLFETNHQVSVAQLEELFAKYSPYYRCEKMPEGSEFDYVLYFTGQKIDEYYYCVKMEMGHTVYHRFLQEDYAALM